MLLLSNPSGYRKGVFEGHLRDVIRFLRGHRKGLNLLQTRLTGWNRKSLHSSRYAGEFRNMTFCVWCYQHLRNLP